jgi:hypothetical protein
MPWIIHQGFNAMVSSLLIQILAAFKDLGGDTSRLQTARIFLASPGCTVDISLIVDIFRYLPFPTLILLGEVIRDAPHGSLSLRPCILCLHLDAT